MKLQLENEDTKSSLLPFDLQSIPSYFNLPLPMERERNTERPRESATKPQVVPFLTCAAQSGVLLLLLASHFVG